MKVTDIYVARYFGPTAHRGARVAVRRADCRRWELVEDRDPAVDPKEQITRMAERLSGGVAVYIITEGRSGDLLVLVAHPDTVQPNKRR